MADRVVHLYWRPRIESYSMVPTPENDFFNAYLMLKIHKLPMGELAESMRT